MTAPTDDLAPPALEPTTLEPAPVDDAEPSSRVGRVRAWFTRPVLSDDDADPTIETPDAAITEQTDAPTEEAGSPTEATASVPPVPDLDPSWSPADPLPTTEPTQDQPSSPLPSPTVPLPPAPLQSEPLPSTRPEASPRAKLEAVLESRSLSPSLAVDVLPQPRRTARPSLGDIAVLEVDLQSIDRAMAYAQRPEIAPGLGRYASFMARAACIVTEECGRTGGRPITIEVEGHAPGRRVRVARADEMRLAALARVLHHGDDRTDGGSNESPAVRVALSGSSDGRMIIAGSAADAPTLTLIHLGKRTVTTTDSLGFQVSSEHTMGLITVAAGSTPVAADAYLARVKSILERRDWVGELD